MSRDLLEHDVADRMPARVVDLLEMIEIDRGDGDGRAAPAGLSQIGREAALRTLGDSGNR